MPESSEHGSADLRQAWGAVAAVALGTFVMVTTEFLPIGLLTSMSRDLHVSEGTAGLMVTTPGIVAAVAAPVVTIVARRIDRRLVLVTLACLILVSDAIVAVSSDYRIVLSARVLLGISVGGFWTFAAAVGRRLVPAVEGGRATALILAGISIGTVVGVPIGTTIGSLMGWRWAFGGVAALSLLAVVAQWILLPPLPSQGTFRFRDFRSTLLVPRAVIGFAATGLIASGHFAAYTYFEPFLKQVASFSPGGLSWALAAYGLAGVLGNVIGERASARNVRNAFVGVGIALSAAIISVIAIGSSAYAVTTVAIVLWGVSFGAVPVAVQIWTFEAAPEKFESASSLMVSVFQVALATGAFAGGKLVDHVGLRSAFALGAGLSALSALVVFVSSRVEPLPQGKFFEAAMSGPTHREGET